MVVEICANSFESALAAQEGGAHRIELCTNLSVGGLTPSYELIEKVVKEISIPIHVLIRPRKGDFYYTTTEINEMIKDIEFCKKSGCKGVVSGVLTLGNNIDINATQQLIKAANGMNFTFYRAFDCVENAIESLKQLMELKIKRVLSSGQKQTAIEGIYLLNEMKSVSNNKIEIMPGSGINTQNVMAFKDAGFKSIHLSATIKPKTTMVKNSFFESDYEGVSDKNTIQKIVSLVTKKVN